MTRIYTFLITLVVCLSAVSGFAWQTERADTLHTGLNVFEAPVTLSDSLTATTIDASGVIDGVSGSSQTTSVSGVSFSDVDYGNIRKATITMDDVVLYVSYHSGDVTNAWGSAKICDFPEGRILVHGVTVSGVLGTFQTNAIPYASGGVWALGTEAATTNTFTNTMADLCVSISADTLTNITSGALSASAQFDGTTTAKDMYFNFGLDQDDYLIAGGTRSTNSMDAVIVVHYTNLGDY